MIDVKVSCEEGLCRRQKAGVQPNACMGICGYSSCLDAQEVIEDCDISMLFRPKHKVNSEKSHTCVCLNGKLTYSDFTLKPLFVRDKGKESILFSLLCPY